MQRILDPKKIEDKSFKIIGRMIAPLRLLPGQRDIVMRVVHATTDLDYAKGLLFGNRAVEAGIEAIRKGKDIICDVGMVKAGINKKILSDFGGKIICLIDDEDVIRRASRLKIARAIVAMKKVVPFMDGAIVSIGNAPTALFELCDLVKDFKARPALIIGVPVGFVGAKEAKRQLTTLDVPYITNSTTKGGSSVAAAITNALLKMAKNS